VNVFLRKVAELLEKSFGESSLGTEKEMLAKWLPKKKEEKENGVPQGWNLLKRDSYPLRSRSEKKKRVRFRRKVPPHYLSWLFPRKGGVEEGIIIGPRREWARRWASNTVWVVRTQGSGRGLFV